MAISRIIENSTYHSVSALGLSIGTFTGMSILIDCRTEVRCDFRLHGLSNVSQLTLPRSCGDCDSREPS